MPSFGSDPGDAHARSRRISLVRTGTLREVDTVLPWIVIALLIVVTCVGVSRESGSKRRDHRRLERKLDLVLDHLGIQEPAGELGAELTALLRQGKKVEAIRRFQQVTGAGLKEAKHQVDRMDQS